MSGHHDDPPGPPTTTEVADGVFAYIQPDGSWWINNTGFVVGAEDVVAIDASSTERRTRAFLDAIAAVAPQPVRTMVDTHTHGDHTNGHCLFGDATVVGHRNCREGVRNQVIGGLDAVFGSVEWGALTIRPPSVVLDERLDVYAGDRLMELHYIGMPAHTTGDVVAWLPEERVLFAGDLVFNGGTPFVLMGSVEGALDALERLRSFDAAVIVPGHGPVCEAGSIDVVERYLRLVLDVARQARAAGIGALEAARDTDLGEFAELRDSERIVGNLHRALLELEGAPRGAPIDVISAFMDMIDYNGGSSLRCLA